LTFDQARLNSLRANATAEEIALLEDGELTFEEYEAGYTKALSCLYDSGLVDVFERPELSPRWVYNWPVRFSDANRVAATAAFERCRAEHFSTLEFLWAEATAPTQEEVQAARIDLAQCLRDAGHDVEENPTSATFLPFIYEADPDLRLCSTVVSDRYALPGFAG